MASIKTLAAALIAASLVVSQADAATFTMKRGLNLDLWTTWPGPDRWGDAKTILPFPEWRKTLKPSDLKALKADGLDFLRMPVDPAPFLSDQTAALRDRLYASVLDSARMINAAGLKVVVDLHIIPGGNGRVGTGDILGDPALFSAYLDVVRTMGRTLAEEDPSKVALELMNEPTQDCDGHDGWSDKAKQLFAAARASATRTTLVLSGGCYSNAESLSKLDPAAIADDNVIWAFHSYDPFLLTHQGATWAGDFIPYVTGLPYPPYAASADDLADAVDRIKARIRRQAPPWREAGLLSYLDEQVAAVGTKEKLDAQLDAPFDRVAAWAKAHGIKAEDITLGEFGMIRQEYGTDTVMPGAYRAAYARDMISRAEARGYSWSLWEYGGAFGVVDAFDGAKAEPDVVEMLRHLPTPSE